MVYSYCNSSGLGDCYYQGFNLDGGKEVFKHSFKNCSKSIIEFVSAVHSIRYLKQNKIEGEVYVDLDVNCIADINKKKFSCDYKNAGDAIKEFTRRCEMYLFNNFKNQLPICKWKPEWGEFTVSNFEL